MAADTTDLRVDVQEPSAWTRRLSITVPSERVSRIRRSVTSQIARSVRLPGFRKGKTPSGVIERQFGPHIERETMDQLVQEAFAEAVRSGEYEPINQGAVENARYTDDGELAFEVEFEVRPTPALERVGGFVVARPSDEVGDDEVDAVLERLRDERGVMHPLEEGRPDYGDEVMVEITELDGGDGDGEAEEEPAAHPYRFQLGEGQAIPDIEQAIMTLEPGQADEFTVHFPDDFPDEAQRGKEQRLRISLTSASRKELPELDDDFASEVGDFDTLDALRERVRGDLSAEAAKRADAAVRDSLIRNIVEADPFEVPESMVERWLDWATGTDEERMAGANAEQREQISQYRAAVRPQAVGALQRMIVVETLAEREGLRATQDDVDARVEALAEEHGRKPSEIWLELERNRQLQALESEITENKVFEHLLEQNTVEQAAAE